MDKFLALLPLLIPTIKKINYFVENYISVFQTNHRSSNALFAIATVCCLHLYQVHALVFLPCIFAVIFKQTGRNYIIKLISVMIASLCLILQAIPGIPQISDGYLHNVTDLQGDKILADPEYIKTKSNWELVLLIFNYMVTLMVVYLNSKMHVLSPIGDYGICVMYPNVARYEADNNLKLFLKYIVNFAFYKFGMEICWLAVALQITMNYNHLNVLALLMLWCCLAPRKSVHQCWSFLRGTLVMTISFKYINSVFSKPVFPFVGYQTFWNMEDFGLPSLHDNYVTNSELIWNFIVILLVDRQLWVFCMHWEFYGGSNQEIWKNFDDYDMKNRISDYLNFHRTWLDKLKSFFLPKIPWLVLCFVLITSLCTGQVYSVIYFILVCQLLCTGSSHLYMQPIASIMHKWQMLIFYTVFVITMKFLTLSLSYLIERLVPTITLHELIERIPSKENEDCILWMLLSLKCPGANPFKELADSAFLDAIYLGMLLMVRRLTGSLYFLHIRDDVRGQDFLDDWGPALLLKATQEQNKRKKVVLDRLKATVKSRRGSELTNQPPLKNAVVDQGMELPLDIHIIPYSLTQWFWSTTVAFRFIEFSLKIKLKTTKEEKQYFRPENKNPATSEDLADLWSQFEKNGLSELLAVVRPLQLVQSVWLCLQAHSQYVCFMLVFALQGQVYTTVGTIILPLSVLYASWRHPRPPTWYWNILLGFTFVLMIAKIQLFSSFFGKYFEETFGSGPPYLEAMLFIAILWHRSILRPLGLWDFPLSEEVIPERVATVDVYVAIGLLEMASLLLVCFTYSSFGAEQSDGGVVEYVTKDNMPFAFMLVLLIHFLSMALDRILYVSAAFKWRGIFHSVVWCSLHAWLFIYVQLVTERPFGYHASQKVYYLMQCMYLLLSAYQVRTQHSRCSAVSVLCQRFNYCNYFFFIIYSRLPFVEAIRRTIDFLFTETKLTREEFVIIESIFEKVFEVKCDRVNEYKSLMNRKTKTRLKAIGGVIAVLISLIYLASPVMYFLIEDVATNSNPIKLLKVELSTPTLGTIYNQQINRFDTLTQSDWDKMYSLYANNRKAKTFLNEFTAKDIMLAHLPTIAIKPWVTSTSRADLADKLRNTSELVALMRWDVEREYRGHQDYGGLTGIITAQTNLENSENMNTTEIRKDALARLADMVALDEPQLVEPVEIPNILPKYLLFTKTYPSNIIPQLSYKDKSGASNLLLKLVDISDGKDGWAWQIQENCRAEEYLNHVSRLPGDRGCDTVDIYLFSDHPPFLNAVIGNMGIIGLYALLVFGMFRVIAAFWKRELHEIIYDEMVSVDRVLQLCLDIYQSRITHEIELELALGLKLINIFCSPTEIEAWTCGQKGVDPRTLNKP